MQVALSLTPLVFSPGEYLPPGFLYIIQSGLASFSNRWYTPGKIWGGTLAPRTLPDHHQPSERIGLRAQWRLR